MNDVELLVEVISARTRFQMIKTRLEIENSISKFKDSVYLCVEAAVKSALNDRFLLINERLDALEESRRNLIWEICEGCLQLLESGFQDDNSSLKFEESEQDSGDRVAAKRAIISNMLEDLGLDETRVLELLGEIEAVKGCAGETVWDVHGDTSPSVGCGDTPTVGDVKEGEEGFEDSSSSSLRGGESDA